MRTTIDRRRGALAALLLVVFALSAIFASTAFAASSTPAAGTQGRGGVALAPVTPVAGTQGRGGIALSPASVAAGADFRGGDIAAAATSASGNTASSAARGVAVRGATGSALVLAGRGRVSAVTATSATNAGWLAGGVAVALLFFGLLVWELSRGARRAGELASVTSIGEASAQRASSQAQQSERKAA